MISFTIVSQQTWPEYPKNVDVLDAWCFSGLSMKVREELMVKEGRDFIKNTDFDKIDFDF